MLVEFGEKNFSIIDEILEKLRTHPDFELLWLNHEPMLLLPGLDVNLAHRKVFCGDQEVNLTAKEYDLLCLLVANKGQVLTYDQIYQKVWKETVFGKTFTMANVIQVLQKSVLVIAHNKTLAARLYGEFKEIAGECSGIFCLLQRLNNNGTIYGIECGRKVQYVVNKWTS